MSKGKDVKETSKATVAAKDLDGAVGTEDKSKVEDKEKETKPKGIKGKSKKKESKWPVSTPK